VCLEGREDSVIGPELVKEPVSNDGRILAFRQALSRGKVEQAQRFIKDAALYLRPYVDVFVIDGPEPVCQGFWTEDDRNAVRGIAEAAGGRCCCSTADRAAASILAVYKKGKGSPDAPSCGAMPKKRLNLSRKRCFS
jgi:hypothetical protein